MGFTTILYEEPNQDTYEGVEIIYGSGKEISKIFNSGNFVKDWYDRTKFISLSEETKNEPFWLASSSVDHFIMDGDKYISCRLIHYSEDDYELIDNEKYFIEFMLKGNEIGIEFFLDEKTKNMTWKELKNYCENKNNYER